MTALIIALTLLCAALMFLVPKEYKLAILFMGTMLLSFVVMPVKGIKAMMVITVAFLISELPDIRIHLRRIRFSVMLPYLILVLFSFVLAVVTSPNLHNLNDFGYFTLSEVIVKQFALIYGFLILRRKRSLKPLLMVSFAALVLMTLIGYFNLLTGSSFYIEQLAGDIQLDYDFTHKQRFRVQATFVNPFDYGYMCVLLALLHLYGYLQRMEMLSMLAVSQACCLFGVVSCNCRTILFCYLVCALIFAVALQKSRWMKLQILLGAIAAGVLIVMTVPAIRKVFFMMLTIFDATSMVNGSSLAMRLLQFTTVLYYISGSYVWFGRGVHFFEQDLGWENGSALASDYDLFGLEGIYLNLLLERGVVGFAIYLAMMVLILVFIIRHRKLGRLLYSLGLSVFLLYFLFSFMTGELLSATPTFYILGYVIANQTLRKRFLEWRRKKCRA